MISLEGKIVNMDRVFRGRIEIGESGIINRIGEPTGDADFIFKDELIFPGFIDLHVHAREDTSHTQDYKEDFVTAGQAAINGGVVAFAEMPNNPVAPTDDKSYADKKELIKKSAVGVVLYAGIGVNTKPLSVKVPYKVFMGPSVGSLFFESLAELEEAIKEYKGCAISFHCEDPKILEENASKPTHLLRRPVSAEISAIDFALQMIEKYNLAGKICHCSTEDGIEKIKNAKMRKVNVVAEVTPHHLFFDETMPNLNKKNLQVNPPIRQTKENRLALIEALRRGDIDYLATDHAPHTIEEKEKGISGMPHLDTYGAFVTWLMQKHSFSASDVARVCSVNPGIFIKQFIDDKYGEVRAGYVGSLTVIDMSKSVTITKNQLKTKCGWSPFEGVTFPGQVVMTVVRGKIYDKR